MAIGNILDLFRQKGADALVSIPEEAPMMSLAAPLTDEVPATGPQMSLAATPMVVEEAPAPQAPVALEPQAPIVVKPVTAESTTRFASAFDPRAWAQPTADFFEAYTAGTAGSDFF